MGFWAAGSACAALAWASDDGVIPTRTSRVHDATALLGLDRAGNGVAMRAELASLDPDGFTLEWSLPPSAPWTVHYLALGGPAVAGGAGRLIASPVSPGRQTVPLDGIEPDLVLFLPAAGPRREGRRSRACRSGSVRSRGNGRRRRGSSPATGRKRATSGVLSEPTPRSWPSPTARSLRASAESRSPGRMRWRSTGPRPPRSRPRFRISPSRVSARRIGTHISPTEPGSRATRGVGFRPDALVLFTWGLHPSTQPTDIGRLCLGGATSPASSGLGGRRVSDDQSTERVAP